MSNFIQLSWQSNDNIAVVTLKRPESLNALNRQLLEELRAVAFDLASNRGIRAVVFTGAGDKAFCAGADLKERKDMSLDDTRKFVSLISDVFTQIAKLPMPTIAAINGVAFGGGLELALACDMRVMQAGKEVGLTECALGIIPGAGGTQRLPRLVGEAKAKELIFSARRVGADEAAAIGLVNRVAGQDETAFDIALELAKQIAKCAPLSVRSAKEAIDQGAGRQLEDGLKIEARCYEAIVTSEDRAEGLKAFAEKRTPSFLGR
jgi:methylglutaconyl-CoA hydratase